MFIYYLPLHVIVRTVRARACIICNQVRPRPVCAFVQWNTVFLCSDYVDAKVDLSLLFAYKVRVFFNVSVRWAVTLEKIPSDICVQWRLISSACASHSLLSVFVVGMMKLCIPCCPKCAKKIFWSDFTHAQADLNGHWAHMSKVRFLTLLVRYIF